MANNIRNDKSRQTINENKNINNKNKKQTTKQNTIQASRIEKNI